MSTVARRSFLSALALSPVLVACSRQSAHTSASSGGTKSPQAVASTHPDSTGSTALEHLYTPSSPEYSAAKQLFDPEFDARRPAAVAAVTSADEVTHAINYARTHNLRVAARSGGHSYIGASAPDKALVVDLRGLSQISYDPKTQQATVGAGARLYDVNSALAAQGRAIPTGTCPTVGVSGLTAGGGIGVSSRQHGLTSDALVSAQVALPDGTLVTADAHTNADIFWAIRGGGGGLVGIVTQWTFTTHPATSHGSFTLDVPTTGPEQIVQGWGSWVTTAPRTQWANLHLTSTGDDISIRFVGITASGEQQSAASALLKSCGVTATRSVFRDRSHMDTVKFLGGGTTSARTRFVAGSDVLRTIDATAAAALVSAIRRAPANCVATLDPLTGAVQDTPTNATAFPWRQHVADVQWYSGSTSATARSWIRSVHDDVAQASVGRYLNYPETGTDLKTYLGPNASRANSIRSAHDPKNLLITSLGS